MSGAVENYRLMPGSPLAARAREMFDAGCPDTVIADALDVSPNTVFRWRKREGLRTKYRPQTRTGMLVDAKENPPDPVLPPCPVSVGDTYTFRPHFLSGDMGRFYGTPDRVRGTVEQVNAARRWFRVAFRLNGVTLRETFRY